jgi:hypothetical protein
MSLESIPKKQLQEIEELATKLLVALRKAKSENVILLKEIEALKEETGTIRRTRFDAENPEYSSY